MDLVHEIGWLANSHQRAPGVNVILPAIEFLVVLESDMVSLVLGLQQQTIRLQIYPFNVRYILQHDHALRGGGLRNKTSINERGKLSGHEAIVG